MYKYINECVAYCLKGKIVKYSLTLIIYRFISIIKLLYLISVLYLILFDTSLHIVLFKNTLVATLIYIFLITIGVSLHYISLWFGYLLKRNIISQFQPLNNISFSFKFLSKLFFIRIYVFVAKTVEMLFFLIPFVFVSVVFLRLLKNGISKSLILPFLFSCILLFIVGLITGLLSGQKYCFAEYFVSISSKANIFKIVNNSKFIMDNKCKKLFKLKTKNLLYSIFGIFLPHLYIIKKSREYFFITDKTIEYARKLHTQKSVVFYCKDIIA